MRGGAAGGCGAVFGARRLAGGGPLVQWSHMSAEVKRWWSIDDEWRMKTQPGLGQTDNDGSFPLLRALSCRLIPQGGCRAKAQSWLF
uniref:Uncharacterized protein n=1 Tax=Oryza meridionalis TaxID=40149 RepID=A0A0E0F4E0_9ORYZ